MKVDELLVKMAQELRISMQQCGCNPADPTEVDRFVNGCGLNQKIKQLVCEESEDD